MSIIAILYDKFSGDVIRSERLSDQRARNIDIYNFAPERRKTLELKLKILKDDHTQPLFAKNISDIEIHDPSGRRKEIAVIFQGGLGDHIIARSIIEGLKKKHGRIIVDAFCFRSPEIFDLYNEIRNVTVLDQGVDPKCFAKNQSLKYEVVYDLGLIGGRYENGRMSYTKFPDLYVNYPRSRNMIHKRFPNDHIFKIRGDSVGIKTQIDDIDLFLPERQNNMYVTISGFSDSKIKEWDKWERLIEYINDHGMEVRQIGLKQSYLIDGSKDFRGLEIEKVRDQLGNSLLHLDIDSGLVHFARAVGTYSLTLFGSTSAKNWSYKENRNILSRFNCPYMPCFGSEQWDKCPYTNDPFGRCMQEISFGRVIHGIN